MRYYLNSATGEVRIVRSLTDKHFIVVKVIPGNIRSVKIWHGDLHSTASRWNTKPFNPTASEEAVWDMVFSEAIYEAFTVLSSSL